MVKIQISRADLLARYETMTVTDLEIHYGISRPTLYALLDKAGIPRKLPRQAEAVWPELVD